jgi:hypothetical protein
MIDQVAMSIWLIGFVLFMVFMILLLMVLCFGVMIQMIYRFLKED